MDVDNDDRIKQKDEGVNDVPRQPTADERFNRTLSRAREQLNVSPQESFMPDLVTASPKSQQLKHHKRQGRFLLLLVEPQMYKQMSKTLRAVNIK